MQTALGSTIFSKSALLLLLFIVTKSHFNSSVALSLPLGSLHCFKFVRVTCMVFTALAASTIRVDEIIKECIHGIFLRRKSRVGR